MNSLNLLKQYADTGAMVPKYQLDKMDGNLKGTYLRRRVLQAKESSMYELMDFEIVELSDKLFKEYLKGDDNPLSWEVLENLYQENPERLHLYLEYRFEKQFEYGVYIQDLEFFLKSQNAPFAKKVIENMGTHRITIGDNFFMRLKPDFQYRLLYLREVNGLDYHNLTLDASISVQKKFVKWKLENDRHITDAEYGNILSVMDKDIYIQKQIDSGIGLYQKKYELTPKFLQDKYNYLMSQRENE
jgi:hypothetical protein